MHKHKEKKIISVFFALILVSCGVDPLTGKESPDRSKLVIAYTERLGDLKTFVSIEGKKGRNPKILLICKGIIPVSFAWITNEELNITITNDAIIEKKDLEYENLIFHLNKASMVVGKSLR